ncbi:hypothetical protein QX776_07030 [Alteromonadaceae bacterium BrNp21-10]|nr:hypothetical protein [Alteromonadaceae bacterium BrNp21-10]
MLVRNFKPITLSALVMLATTGCVSTTKVENPVDIISNDNYIVQLQDTEIMPSKSELQGNRSRVVVLPVRNNTKETFESGAIREMSSLIENSLLGAGVEIVDRALASSLGDEIVAYEATGKFSGGGVTVADIAILPSIHNVNVSSSFTPKSTYTKDGKTKTIPSSCSFKGDISGNVKIYQLPELSVIDGHAINGSYSNSDISNDSRCQFSKEYAATLASKATAEGVGDVINKVKNHFRQKGYVVEYRKRDDDHLVQISIGSERGLKVGQKIQFTRTLKRTNRLTNETTISVIPYDFEGTVSELLEPTNAWIIVDEKAQGQLKFGDGARQFFRDATILEAAGGFVGNLVN